MALLLKQDDEIVIPSSFTHNGNSINSIFGERIILDETDITDEWEHPLFKAMVKFLFSPVSGDNQNYSNIERYLDEFLSVSYMRNAAEETDGMEINSDEYKRHITEMWKKLSDMPIGDLLIGTKEHIGVNTFGKEKTSGLDYTIRLMPAEGKEQTLKNINLADEQESWEKMVGYKIKHSKLIEVANAKGKHRVYREFIDNLDSYKDHITITAYPDLQNAAKEFNLGSERMQNAPAKDLKLFIDIEIDFKSMFEEEMARDDILEGMPKNEWIPPTNKAFNRMLKYDDAQSRKNRSPGHDMKEPSSWDKEQLERTRAQLGISDKTSTKQTSTKQTDSDWNIKEHYPAILINKETGKDREFTEEEKDLWQEILDVVHGLEETKEEEEFSTQEEKDFYAHLEDESTQTSLEDLDAQSQVKEDESELWSEELEDEDDEDDEDKMTIPLGEHHHELIVNAVKWQMYHNLQIEQWQEDIVVQYNKIKQEKNFRETAKIHEKKVEKIVHAPMGTKSQAKRIFKKDPKQGETPELDLVNAYEIDGSEIQSLLRSSLNPSEGVILKLSISGYLDRDEATKEKNDNTWEDKVYGVFYLTDAKVEKKVTWGYSGVVTPKTTTAGEPGKTKGAWSQEESKPSRDEKLGRGRDKPTMPYSSVQPGASTHEIPEPIDPETKEHRRTEPEVYSSRGEEYAEETGEHKYPTTTISYDEGFKSRGRRGALDFGGAMRGEYGQQKYIVLMGYLRKQYKRIEEMIDNA